MSTTIILCGIFMAGMVITAIALCRTASEADWEIDFDWDGLERELSEVEDTGTEAISDARIRELLTRERYERECV